MQCSLMTVAGTRLGRQSNSVKLSTLMLYQCDNTGQPSRLSVDDKIYAWSGRCRDDSLCDDQSDGGSLLPTTTRSNSDASSLSSTWRERRRRRSDTDSLRVDTLRQLDVSYVNAGTSVDTQRQKDISYLNAGTSVDTYTVQPHQTLVDSRCNSVVSEYDIIRPDTNQTTLPSELPAPSDDHCAPHAIDSSTIDTGSQSETYCHRQWLSANHQSPDTIDNGTIDRRNIPSVNQALCTSAANTVDHRTIDMAVSPLRSEQRNMSSVSECDVTTSTTAIETSADMNDSTDDMSPADDVSPVADVSPAAESSGELFDTAYCRKSTLHMDVDHDYDQLMFRDPVVLFSFLANAFRELDEIMNRVRTITAIVTASSSSSCHRNEQPAG